MAKTDRRFLKTEQAITQSLLKLLNQSDANDLSLDALIEMANINKSTFYIHYRSLEDAINAFENAVLVQFTSSISDYKSIVMGNVDPFLKSLLADIAANRLLYRAAFIHGSQRFYGGMENVVAPLFGIVLPSGKRFGTLPEEDYFKIARLAGFISLLRLWVMDKCRFPEDHFLKMLHSFLSIDLIVK